METALKIVQKLYTPKAVRLLTKKQKIKKALKSVRFLNNAIKKQFGTKLAIAKSKPKNTARNLL